MTTGLIIAICGAAVCAAFAGIGSANGVQCAGKAAAGVCAEKPELFGKLLVLQALPGTQGIYGFLVSVLIMVQTGVLSGSPANLSIEQGLAFFCAGLPIAIVGWWSGIYQGRTAAASIHMTGKDPSASAKGITMTALVETYAILALLVSILLLFGITV
ncbi:MAG: V-type ATP synthase subunit K [Eubacterium aggregans]|uniref:V/A-type H+-transporting ATPase subunit K n=1 Tax=Eubacterium aggregans TaxID=81409 RepID=A0A1H3ZJX3_9FIRM|nr:V-type ATP synthase subunit K [Eubacterium aggregans]MDD4690877.1 V-type ATP synthase subunit K [Eubacterium aggregans]MEA5074053.1 V-type ATP synthase subunit K [Eubacterium aggregans]SEA24069.1 V/A-type H+-transporting ATPase subunit K [Eubacterium aggregans]